jgi:hypothetical protein
VDERDDARLALLLEAISTDARAFSTLLEP